jgi:hypothetical protein
VTSTLFDFHDLAKKSRQKISTFMIPNFLLAIIWTTIEGVHSWVTLHDVHCRYNTRLVEASFGNNKGCQKTVCKRVKAILIQSSFMFKRHIIHDKRLGRARQFSPWRMGCEFRVNWFYKTWNVECRHRYCHILKYNSRIMIIIVNLVSPKTTGVGWTPHMLYHILKRQPSHACVIINKGTSNVYKSYGMMKN